MVCNKTSAAAANPAATTAGFPMLPTTSPALSLAPAVCVAPMRASCVCLLCVCAGRDLHSALQLTAAGSGERVFGWHRRGRRVAYEVARALNYLHSKVGGMERGPVSPAGCRGWGPARARQLGTEPARRQRGCSCCLVCFHGCLGFHAAHLLTPRAACLATQGVTHMDVKSGNVLLTACGEARLSDVGLSRHQALDGASDATDTRCIGTFNW